MNGERWLFVQDSMEFICINSVRRCFPVAPCSTPSSAAANNASSKLHYLYRSSVYSQYFPFIMRTVRNPYPMDICPLLSPSPSNSFFTPMLISPLYCTVKHKQASQCKHFWHFIHSTRVFFWNDNEGDLDKASLVSVPHFWNLCSSHWLELQSVQNHTNSTH